MLRLGIRVLTAVIKRRHDAELEGCSHKRHLCNKSTLVGSLTADCFGLLFELVPQTLDEVFREGVRKYHRCPLEGAIAKTIGVPVIAFYNERYVHIVRLAVFALERLAVVQFHGSVDIVVGDVFHSVQLLVFVLTDHLYPSHDDFALLGYLVGEFRRTAIWQVDDIVHTFLSCHRRGVVVRLAVLHVSHSESLVIFAYKRAVDRFVGSIRLSLSLIS